MATAIPFDQREGIIWMDGVLVPWKEAKIHVLTHALHYGTGVFEGMRVYQGKIFKSKEHNERLINSGKIVDVPIPYSASELANAVYTVLDKNHLTDAYVRPIAWRGSEQLGVQSDHNQVHVAIAAWEWPSYYGSEMLEKGISLGPSPWKRPHPETVPVQAKATGIYLIGSINKNQAHREGYDDVLMLDYKGKLAECSGSNIFFVRGKEIHTPAPECFLNGITRQTLIEIASAEGYPVIERDIDPDELSSFNEVFVTGTAAEVTPVGAIYQYRYSVGPITKTLRELYSKLVNS